MHCSLCGVPGSNKMTCPLNMVGGGKKSRGIKSQHCVHCGSEWIYKAPAGREMLCDECYTEMHTEVVEYHELQDKAEQHVKENKIELAVALLKQAIDLRNNNTRFFGPIVHDGHDFYANTFLPELIKELEKSLEPYKTWQNKFKELENV